MQTDDASDWHSERSEESRPVYYSDAQSEIPRPAAQSLRATASFARNDTHSELCPKTKKDLPAFGVGPVLLSKHERRLDFSSHPVGPQGLGLCCAFSNPGLGEHSYPKRLDDRMQHKVLCMQKATKVPGVAHSNCTLSPGIFEKLRSSRVTSV